MSNPSVRHVDQLTRIRFQNVASFQLCESIRLNDLVICSSRQDLSFKSGPCKGAAEDRDHSSLASRDCANIDRLPDVDLELERQFQFWKRCRQDIHGTVV